MKIILATFNKGKLNELKTCVANPSIQLLSLSDVNFSTPIDESGSTFEENAKIKAEIVHLATQQTVLSDDSGLIVEALNGAPGVYSARYAGANANDDMNIQKLLLNLKDIENRQASFVTVLAFNDGNKTYFFDGRVNGTITKSKLGNNGFGYDPVFIPEGCSKTFAQMTPEEKNQHSHRAKAVNKLVDFLKNYVSYPK